MSDEWGVGKEAEAKSFAKIKLKDQDQIIDLIHGEHPHSRQDNRFYARFPNGDIEAFDGHVHDFKIEIEEYNYLKTSGLSGNEIRKGGSAKLYSNGVLCFSTFCRSYESGYRFIQEFISKMENQFFWYPHKLEEKIGKIVGFREQLFEIKSFMLEEGCILLRTLDGKSRKRFVYEDNFEYEKSAFVKDLVSSESICWYPGISVEND